MLKYFYYAIALLVCISSIACKTSAPKEETVAEEEVSKIPHGAIPITLNEEGFLVEARINNVPAVMLLKTRFLDYALDSTFGNDLLS
jgi:hypothetical protein